MLDDEGEESGSGAAVGSTLCGMSTAGDTANVALDEVAEFSGDDPVTDGECGGDPSVDDNPPTTEGVKCTFFGNGGGSAKLSGGFESVDPTPDCVAASTSVEPEFPRFIVPTPTKVRLSSSATFKDVDEACLRDGESSV